MIDLAQLNNENNGMRYEKKSGMERGALPFQFSFMASLIKLISSFATSSVAAIIKKGTRRTVCWKISETGSF